MKIEFKIDVKQFKSHVQKLQKDFNQKVIEAMKEVPVKEIIVEEKNKADLGNITGKLESNWNVEVNESELELKVSTNTEYARIHDQGGWNGRNHASYQRPRFYFTNAMNRIREELFKALKAKFRK